MSYSLINECFNCVNEEKCSDKNIIEGAIYAIHKNGNDNGHRGAGTITLDCENAEQKEDEKTK